MFYLLYSSDKKKQMQIYQLDMESEQFTQQKKVAICKTSSKYIKVRILN